MESAQTKTVDPKHAERVANIEKYEIPKITLSRLADVNPSDVSKWITDPENVSAKKRGLLEAYTDGIVDFLQALEQLPYGLKFAFDLRDSDTVREVLKRVAVEGERKQIAQDESFDTILAGLPDEEMQWMVRALVNKCAEMNFALVVNLTDSKKTSTLGYAPSPILHAMNEAWQRILSAPVQIDYLDQRAASTDLASIVTAKK